MFPTPEHIQAAQESADYWYAKTGVYSFPSFRLAQTGIESANGTALSGLNNYWGVKANAAQIAAGQFKVCKTREVINGKTVTIDAKFASYPSLKEGYIQQAELLVTSHYYEKSRHDNNPKQYAIDVAVHYATSPIYAQTIIKYMDEHNLYKYDHVEHKADPTIKLQPPVSEQKKVTPPSVTGSIIAGTTIGATLASQSPHWALFAAGTVVTVGFVALAYVKHVQAEAFLKKILAPATPEVAK